MTPKKIITFALDLVGGGNFGVLATVDQQGRPHIRWMGTVSSPRLVEIVTLTAPESEKVSHIRLNPNVSWLFADAAMRQVVQIHGKAHVVEDLRQIKSDWKLVEDKSHAYFLHDCRAGPGFAAIETKLETLLYSVPKERIFITLTRDEILRAQGL